MRHPETRDIQTMADCHAGAGQLASSRPARRTILSGTRLERDAYGFLITHHPSAGLRHDGPSASWERGLPAHGKLTKAALRAPSAGKDAHDPMITATLASPPDRAESCA